MVAGISAWYLLKGRHVAFARRYLLTGLVAGLALSATMPFLGDWQASVVAEQQPIKLAAFEGIYLSQKDAPMTIIGWYNSGANEVDGLKIPGLLSFLAFGSTHDVVKGLASVPAADRPPVQLTFQTYHLMVMLSGYFVAVMLVALLFVRLRRIERMRWLLWLLVISAPLPIVASELGWVSAEVGRQPWIVYGLLRTRDGVSAIVPAEQVALSLGLLVAMYVLLGGLYLYLLRKELGRGPAPAAGGAGDDGGGGAPTAPAGPAPKAA